MRGHVTIARSIALLVGDSDAPIGSYSDALVMHRLAECIGAGNNCDSRQVALLKIGEYFFAGHLVGVRGFKHPFVYRLNDLDGAGKRNEWYLGIFKDRDHRQRRAGRGAANHRINLVFLNQTGGKCSRIVCITAVIVNDELKLLTVHTAFRVDIINIHFQCFLLGVA